MPKGFLKVGCLARGRGGEYFKFCRKNNPNPFTSEMIPPPKNKLNKRNTPIWKTKYSFLEERVVWKINLICNYSRITFTERLELWSYKIVIIKALKKISAGKDFCFKNTSVANIFIRNHEISHITVTFCSKPMDFTW